MEVFASRSMLHLRPNPLSERLKIEYMQVMADLHGLEIENIEALDNFKDHEKDSLFNW